MWKMVLLIILIFVHRGPFGNGAAKGGEAALVAVVTIGGSKKMLYIIWKNILLS